VKFLKSFDTQFNLPSCVFDLKIQFVISDSFIYYSNIGYQAHK